MTGLLDGYREAGLWLFHRAPAADKFLHSWVGLALWLGFAVLLRRPLRSPVPLLLLLAAEAANEVMDRATVGSWQWDDTVADVVVTLFWPLVIALLLRWRPALGGRR